MALSNIGKGAIISYVAIFFNIAISFLYTPWMLKQIGVSDYGLYNLVLSFISYFVIDFGLGGALSRFIAKYRAEGNDRKVENVLGLTLKMFFYIDLIIFSCLLICYLFISDIFRGLTLDEIRKLKVLYIIASSFSVLSFSLKPLEGTLTAYEYFVPAKILDMIYKVGSVLLIVVALLLGGNIYILVLINGILSFITSILRYLYWHHQTKLVPNIRFNDRNEMKEIFSFSGWTFMIGLAQRFRLNLVPSILGIFSNSTQIAVFSLGMTLEAMIWTLSSALNGLFLPRVSQLSYEKDDSSLMDLMIRVGRIQLYVFFAIFSVFFIFGEIFIVLWVGDRFRDVYFIVIALILTYVISTTMQVAVDKIYADNKVRKTAVPTFATSLIGLFASCLIACDYGAVGCASCSGVALIINQILYVRIYKKDLGLDVTAFFKACHLRILPCLMFFVALFLMILTHFCIDSWGGLITCSTIYMVSYGIIIYFLLFNNYEKSLFKSIIRKS